MDNQEQIYRSKIKISRFSKEFQSIYKNYIETKIRNTNIYLKQNESLENKIERRHFYILQHFNDGELAALDYVNNAKERDISKSTNLKNDLSQNYVRSKLKSYMLKQYRNKSLQLSKDNSHIEDDYGDKKLIMRDFKNFKFPIINGYVNENEFVKTIYNSDALKEMKCIDLKVKVKTNNRLNTHNTNNKQISSDSLVHVTNYSNNKKISFTSSNENNSISNTKPKMKLKLLSTNQILSKKSSIKSPIKLLTKGNTIKINRVLKGNRKMKNEHSDLSNLHIVDDKPEKIVSKQSKYNSTNFNEINRNAISGRKLEYNIKKLENLMKKQSHIDKTIIRRNSYISHDLNDKMSFVFRKIII
jgi:hypothetical protein